MLKKLAQKKYQTKNEKQKTIIIITTVILVITTKRVLQTFLSREEGHLPFGNVHTKNTPPCIQQ